MPFCSRRCQCPLAFAIPVYPDPPCSIYQDMLSASVDTAECLASASCRLEMPSTSHLLRSTLGLDQRELVHKYTSILSFPRITLRFVPHFLLDRTEPELPAVVISITGYLPSPTSLYTPLLVSWEHLQMKLHGLKCFPTTHNQARSFQKTVGDSVEHP